MKRSFQQQGTQPFYPVREITEDDLLTWRVQLMAEGTLPPDVQRRLLEHVTNRGPLVQGGEK